MPEQGNSMKYFFALYDPLPRGGPGNNECTGKAYRLIKDLPPRPKVLDIGCGPGMQTLELARLSKGEITALDNHQPFLDKLARDAKQAGLSAQIKTVNQDMAAMNFPAESFDLVWSEGALYSTGFEAGLKNCRTLLKPGGYLAVTELVWLKADPTPEAKQWCQDYQEIKSVADNLLLFKNNGYEMIGHFTLPVSAWLEDYYAPLQQRLNELRPKYQGNEAATTVFNTSQAEIDGFKKCSDYVGYESFVAQRLRSS
jgi:SAM-dependent methyltransferase